MKISGEPPLTNSRWGLCSMLPGCDALRIKINIGFHRSWGLPALEKKRVGPSLTVDLGYSWETGVWKLSRNSSHPAAELPLLRDWLVHCLWKGWTGLWCCAALFSVCLKKITQENYLFLGERPLCRKIDSEWKESGLPLVGVLRPAKFNHPAKFIFATLSRNLMEDE